MSILSSSILGVQIFQIISLFITILGFYFYDVNLNTILLVLLGYFLYGCLGIVVTFHRLLTHKSYETHSSISKLFSILGCFSGTGSPIAWVSIHINHHLKSDKLDDPHSPVHKGFKIFLLNYSNEIHPNTKWRMRHLITDKFQQFLHRYYFAIIFLYSLLLYLIGGFYLLIFFHLLPALIITIMSNIVNYVGHSPHWVGSYRTYNINDQSTNNWIWAVPSWGESWHNNHHRSPKNFYFGNKWWEVDISGLIIKLIKK